MNPKALAFDKFMKAEEVTAFERKRFLMMKTVQSYIDPILNHRFGICRCS